MTEQEEILECKQIMRSLLQGAVNERRSLTSLEQRKYDKYANRLAELETENRKEENKQMDKNLTEFRNFLTDESRKSYRFDNEEVRAVTTMADNLDVQQQRIVNMVVQQLIERADLFSLCESFTPANGVLYYLVKMVQMLQKRNLLVKTLLFRLIN